MSTASLTTAATAATDSVVSAGSVCFSIGAITTSIAAMPQILHNDTWVNCGTSMTAIGSQFIAIPRGINARLNITAVTGSATVHVSA